MNERKAFEEWHIREYGFPLDGRGLSILDEEFAMEVFRAGIGIGRADPAPKE